MQRFRQVGRCWRHVRAQGLGWGGVFVPAVRGVQVWLSESETIYSQGRGVGLPEQEQTE